MYVLNWLGYLWLYSDSIWAGKAGVGILVVARFSAPVKKNWGTPSLLYNGFWFFPGVEAAGRFVDHAPTSGTNCKETLELYLSSPSGRWRPVRGRNFTFTLTFTYWRGKRFDLLSLIADMLYLTQYMFRDVGGGCLRTGCWGEYLGPIGTR